MKICLDSVSGDPSLPMKVAIEDVMLQIWTINLSDREGILFLHLCSNGGHKPALMFGVTIQTEVSVSMRFSSCPRPSSSGGSNVTSIYKPESSGDASKITILRLSVSLEKVPLSRNYIPVRCLKEQPVDGEYLWAPHWFIYTRNTDVGHHANPSITINSGWFMTNLITYTHI